MVILKRPSFIAVSMTLLMCIWGLALAQGSMKTYELGQSNLATMFQYGVKYTLSFRYEAESLPDGLELSVVVDNANNVPNIAIPPANYVVNYVASENDDNFSIVMQIPYPNTTTFYTSTSTYISLVIPPSSSSGSTVVFNTQLFPLNAVYWSAPEFSSCSQAFCADLVLTRTVVCAGKGPTMDSTQSDSKCEAVAGSKPQSQKTCVRSEQCFNGGKCISNIDFTGTVQSCDCPQGLSGPTCATTVSFAVNETQLVISRPHQLTWDLGVQTEENVTINYCTYDKSCYSILFSRSLAAKDSISWTPHVYYYSPSPLSSLQLLVKNKVVYTLPIPTIRYDWDIISYGDCTAACGSYQISNTVRCLMTSFSYRTQVYVTDETLCERYGGNKPLTTVLCENSCEHGICNQKQFTCTCEPGWSGAQCDIEVTSPVITSIKLSQTTNLGTPTHIVTIGEKHTVTIKINLTAAAPVQSNYIDIYLRDISNMYVLLNDARIPVVNSTITYTSSFAYNLPSIHGSQSAYLYIKSYENADDSYSSGQAYESDLFLLQQYKWVYPAFPPCPDVCGTFMLTRAPTCVVENGTNNIVTADAKECTEARSGLVSTEPLTFDCPVNENFCGTHGTCKNNVCECTNSLMGIRCDVIPENFPTSFGALKVSNATDEYGIIQGQSYTFTWEYTPSITATDPSFGELATGFLYISSSESIYPLTDSLLLADKTVTIHFSDSEIPASKNITFVLTMHKTSLSIHSTTIPISYRPYWSTSYWSSCFQTPFECDRQKTRDVFCRQPLSGDIAEKTTIDSVCLQFEEKPISSLPCDEELSPDGPVCRNGLCGADHKCACYQGWTGLYCHQPFCDSCNSAHTVGCTNSTLSPSCECAQGWTGSTCDINISCNSNTSEKCLNNGYYGFDESTNQCLQTVCHCPDLFTGTRCDQCDMDCGPHGTPSKDCSQCLCSSRSYYGDICKCRQAFLTLTFTNAPLSTFPDWSNSKWSNFTSSHQTQQQLYDLALRSIFHQITGLDISLFTLNKWAIARNSRKVTLTWSLATRCYPGLDLFVLQSKIDESISRKTDITSLFEPAAVNMQVLSDYNNVMSVYSAINQIALALSQPNSPYFAMIPSESSSSSPTMTTKPSDVIYDEECVGKNADKTICPDITYNPFTDRTGENNASSTIGVTVIFFFVSAIILF